MGWDGSGNFTRTDGTLTGSDICTAQQLAGVPITASKMDNELNEISNGLENCLTRDGQTLPSQNIPMNSKKFTGLANGTASGDSIHYGQLARATWASSTLAAVGGGSLVSANIVSLAYAPLNGFALVLITFYTQTSGTVTAITCTTPFTINTSILGGAPYLHNDWGTHKMGQVSPASSTSLSFLPGAGGATFGGGVHTLVFNGLIPLP